MNGKGLKRLGSLAILLIGMLIWGCAWTADELITNGIFATSGSTPDGWSVDQAVLSKGSIGLSSTLQRDGHAVLELAPNAANTPSGQPLGLGQAIPASALRGKVLNISAWLAARPGAAAVMGVSAVGSQGVLATRQIRQADTGGQLQFKTDTLIVPDQSDILIVYVVADGTSGAVNADSLSVKPAGDAVLAGVAIDASQVGRAVPRELFGTNVEYIRDANGLWDRTANGLNAGVVSLAQSARISLVRFPGGTWSDSYVWTNGVGPRSTRPTTLVSPGSQETTDNAFGTDEALDFARRIGGRLLLTVNAGTTGTAELAANWVKYVNGQGGNAPRVDRVVYWEIGNELYHKADMSRSSITPSEYVTKLKSFAGAMRAVDPGIKIGAIGLENQGRLQFNDYPGWNSTVLSQAGGDIDFLAVHNGYGPVAAGAETADPVDLYQAMLAYPLLVKQNLALTASQIDQYAPGSASRIRIAVTEWGPLFSVDPGSRWVDHVKTLGSAVFTASMIKTFLDSPKTDIANFFKLNEHGFMGWLGMYDSQYVANAQFMVFDLWSNHFGTRLVSATTTSPSYNSVALGWVDAVAGVPYVEASASLSATGDKLYAILINKDLKRPASIDLSLKGFLPGPQASVYLVSGGLPESNLGTTLPAVPGVTWAQQASVMQAGGFQQGGPGQVTTSQLSPSLNGDRLALTLPAHSVAAVEIPRAQ